MYIKTESIDIFPTYKKCRKNKDSINNLMNHSNSKIS